MVPLALPTASARSMISTDNPPIEWRTDMRLLPGRRDEATQRAIRCVGQKEPRGRQKHP